MAKSERQRRGLKSEEFYFDSEASLLDQQDFEMSSCPFNDVFNSDDSHMEQINTFLKNVQVLLEAARFLESADRKDGSEFIIYLSPTLLRLILFICLWISGKQDFIVNRLRQQRAEFIQLSTSACFKHSPCLQQTNMLVVCSLQLWESRKRLGFYCFLDYLPPALCECFLRSAPAQLPAQEAAILPYSTDKAIWHNDWGVWVCMLAANPIW